MRLSSSGHTKLGFALTLMLSLVLVAGFFLTIVTPVAAGICGSTVIQQNSCNHSCAGPGASAPDCPFPNWKCTLRRDNYVRWAETYLYERTGSSTSWQCRPTAFNCPSYCN